MAKNDHFAGLWQRVAQKRHFWKEGVNESLRRWGLGVTLPADKIRLALIFLGSEICVVKKVSKNGIFRTLRCRQLGRRGLNRKLRAPIDFLGQITPLYKISAKKSTKSSREHFRFFLPILIHGTRYNFRRPLSLIFLLTVT